MSTITNVKSILSKQYRMKDVGLVKEFLGMNITYDRNAGVMHLHQSDIIARVLHRFGMENCKGISTPFCKGFANSLINCSLGPLEEQPYREAIGSLLYISMCTRPDITYATTVLSKFCESPAKIHWPMVKRVFRYLQFTINHRLCYERCEESSLKAYSDSDWAGLPERKSTSGLTVYCGNSLIAWRSKRQSIVALSTTEAEMIALVDAFEEFKLANKIISEVRADLMKCQIMCDNQPVISIANGNGYTGRAKHIDVQFLAIQDYVAKGEFGLLYCPTLHNVADVFTKALSKPMYYQLVQILHFSERRQS